VMNCSCTISPSSIYAAAIVTVETLVRWRHPDRRLIQPLTFLPLAEEAGLMSRLTRWVLTRALAHAPPGMPQDAGCGCRSSQRR